MSTLLAFGCATKNDIREYSESTRSVVTDSSKAHADELAKARIDVASLVQGQTQVIERLGRIESVVEATNRQLQDLTGQVGRFAAAARLVDLHSLLAGDWEVKEGDEGRFLEVLDPRRSASDAPSKGRIRMNCPFAADDSRVTCKSEAVAVQVGPVSYRLRLSAGDKAGAWEKTAFLSEPHELEVSLEPLAAGSPPVANASERRPTTKVVVRAETSTGALRLSFSSGAEAASGPAPILQRAATRMN